MRKGAGPAQGFMASRDGCVRRSGCPRSEQRALLEGVHDDRVCPYAAQMACLLRKDQLKLPDKLNNKGIA